MQMRKLSVLLLILVSGMNTCALAQKKNPALLFFQHSDSGTLEAGQEPGCYRVHLSNVGKQVIYLSSAPDEITGRLSIPMFITSWQHQQATQTTKPNAILHASLMTADKKLVQISDAFFIKSISYQGADDSMTYQICRFSDESAFNVGKLQDVNVFVDPFHRWPP